MELLAPGSEPNLAELDRRQELEQPTAPDEEWEGPWWVMIAVYTRDWIHYGAITFFIFLIVTAAIRGLFVR